MSQPLDYKELLKKLLLALEDEINDYYCVGYLHMMGRLSDTEYEELQKLEHESRLENGEVG